jgi:hypothetical protein
MFFNTNVVDSMKLQYDKLYFFHIMLAFLSVSSFEKVYARNADILSITVGQILYMMLFSAMQQLNLTWEWVKLLKYGVQLTSQLCNNFGPLSVFIFVQKIVVNLFIGLRIVFLIHCLSLKKWFLSFCYT